MRRSNISAKIGIWAAWVAVYAFVLNVMLATSLLAAQPVGSFDPMSAICFSHSAPDGAINTADQNDTSKRLSIHCKSCIPGLSGALPSSPASPLFTRVAIAQPQHFAFQACLKQFARTAHYSPRGPPALI